MLTESVTGTDIYNNVYHMKLSKNSNGSHSFKITVQNRNNDETMYIRINDKSQINKICSFLEKVKSEINS